MPLYKEDLKGLVCPCGVPGCESPMVIHSRCHPDRATWVSYYDGILTVKCSVCEQVLAEVFVASKYPGAH